MKKFKLECSWTEYHTGELVLEAENLNDALELLRMEQNRLLEILIEKYANETFSSLSDIFVLNREEESTAKKDVMVKDSEIIFDGKSI